MSELTKILKYYLLSVILIVLTTLLICSVFIAEINTDTMLFG